MLSITEIEHDSIEIEKYYDFTNKTLFTTKEWLDFVEEDSKVMPLILKIEENEKLIGYFTSMTMLRFGIKIVGSPFSGWSTCYMGFDVNEGVDKSRLIDETISYLYHVKKAMLVAITDKDFDADNMRSKGFNAETITTLSLPIGSTDEELFKVFKTDCRNFIRQFERRGASIEIAKADDSFAEEYYRQLTDVFAKQGMVPTYGVEKVKCLLRHLQEANRVLCLKVMDPEGICIATSIFPGYKDRFYFWGGASYRSGQHYRPNEYMIWTAIRYWRENGVKTFDMMGVRDYKRKFGSAEVSYAQITEARWRLLIVCMNAAKKAYFACLKVKGKLLHRI